MRAKARKLHLGRLFLRSILVVLLSSALPSAAQSPSAKTSDPQVGKGASKTTSGTTSPSVKKPIQVYESSDELTSFTDVVKVFRPSEGEPTAVNFTKQVGLYYVPVGNAGIAEALATSKKDGRAVSVSVDDKDFIRSATLQKAKEGAASDDEQDKELQKLMKQMLGQ